MIFPLIPIPFGRIQLYQKPINMRFGERKLTQLCCQELGREPKTNELSRGLADTLMSALGAKRGDYGYPKEVARELLTTSLN